MRIPIRIQLGGLILLSSLIGLAVISIAVWVTTHSFVLDVRASRLTLTASLKAAQLASNLNIMQTSASFVASRVLPQNALRRYNDQNNNTVQSWTSSIADMQAAIGGDTSLGQQLLLQARIYPKNETGVGGPYALLNSTAPGATNIALPYTFPNGTRIPFGDSSPDAGPYGFPPMLYPNLTYFNDVVDDVEVARASFQGLTIYQNATLVLGPWQVNSSFSLISLTSAIVNNTDPLDVLGFETVVMSAMLISQIMDSTDGLDKTGETLLIGPATTINMLPSNFSEASGNNKPDFLLRYVIPLNATYSSRHPNHVRGTLNLPFNATDFPTVYTAFSELAADDSTLSGSNLRSTNEDKQKVSLGYAVPKTSLVQWIVLVEQAREEVWEPINTLRNVILACLFATAGLMAIVAFPLAHFASQPILRLRQATRRSMEPPNSTSLSSAVSLGHLRGGPEEEPRKDEAERDVEDAMSRKEGFTNPITKWRQKRDDCAQAKREERQKRVFKIPGKVKQSRGCIKDELSDLTSTFNEMSDELMMQYSKLEERVQQRTAELELSKKAAEAANESKTLFIANISHELKTPLNGILGMCAVCMQEDDPLRLKRSLGIIYKSGDLLLNLLTDLLTFSKNQVGQHLSLDEKEFRLRDVQSQILAIFDKQAKDGRIDLRVAFEGVDHITNAHDSVSPDHQSQHGPGETGRMRDMILWGDIHRILQVVINLVGNSLKFTPAGGSVTLTIRALPEFPQVGSRQSSMHSRQSRHLSSRQRTSESLPMPPDRLGTSNTIYFKGKPHTNVSERGPSPPPGRYVNFEFEVVDTGPGIPENIQGKIFEPFVQGDLGLSKKFGGTGLGLSICSQLAGLMKGSMSVHSVVGQGATFAMKIPLRHVQTRADSSASSAIDRSEDVSRSGSFEEFDPVRAKQSGHGPIEYNMDVPTPPEFKSTPKTHSASDHANGAGPRLVGLSQPFFASAQPLESPNSQPAAMKQIANEATRGEKIRVLVAEDNKVNQEVVLRMLKLEDIYDVTVAKDGQEALDIVKESMRGGQPFNLIFMDVQMPNVDGLQSTRLIREIGYQAPIVALTAFAEESNIKDCLDSGMNYFLSKPIRRPQLKKVLKQYCAPIPEEDDVSPMMDDRSGTANTTIVMVNKQDGKSEVPPHGDDGNGGIQSGGTSAAPTMNATASSSSNADLRPVSPRHVE